MRVLFDRLAWEDYLSLQADDPDALRRLNAIIQQTRRDPFRGLGKPEPLRGNLKGWWSRRITKEHRLVYRVAGSGDHQTLEIVQCRFHY